MKTQFPGVPILGLTATATASVITDVKKMLSIPSCLVLRASFNRPNLYYQVSVYYQVHFLHMLEDFFCRVVGLSVDHLAVMTVVHSKVRRKPQSSKDAMEDIVQMINSRFKDQSGQLAEI